MWGYERFIRGLLIKKQMKTHEEIKSALERYEKYWEAVEFIKNMESSGDLDTVNCIRDKYSFPLFGDFEDERKTIHEITMDDYHFLKERNILFGHEGTKELIALLKSKRNIKPSKEVVTKSIKNKEE